MTNEPSPRSGLARLRDSTLAKVLGTFLLVLFLQVPIGLIANTIEERRTTKSVAVEEVTRTWGGSQELTGPILSVPFVERWSDEAGKVHERLSVQHFLPGVLTVRGSAVAEVRHRGIFDVPLFTAQLHVEGILAMPDESRFTARPGDILWQRASLSFGIADPKAIRSCSLLSLGVQRLAFAPTEVRPGKSGHGRSPRRGPRRARRPPRGTPEGAGAHGGPGR